MFAEFLRGRWVRRIVTGIADAPVRRDADTTQQSLSGLHPTNNEIEPGELLLASHEVV